MYSFNRYKIGESLHPYLERTDTVTFKHMPNDVHGFF
jgi:hypothetical protein